MVQLVTRTVRLYAVAGIAAALLAVATSAQSRAFRVRFDPLFNAAFSADLNNGQNVGWQGLATIDVADGCLVADSIQTVGEGSCASASLIGGTLLFYDTDQENGLGGIAWAGTFDSPTLLSIDASGDVNGMDFAQAPLTGTTGDIWAIEYDVALDFTLPGDGDPSGSVVLTLTGGDAPPYVSGREQDGPDYQPVVVWEQIQQIPEPATLALVGAALALLGLLRLRRG